MEQKLEQRQTEQELIQGLTEIEQQQMEHVQAQGQPGEQDQRLGVQEQGLGSGVFQKYHVAVQKLLLPHQSQPQQWQQLPQQMPILLQLNQLMLTSQPLNS